jgi:AcrR family transcriptional regulator
MQPEPESSSPVRGRILAAARKRFESFGYRRTGIAEIARDAGVAAGTLYRYFKNKEAILVEVLRELNESWIERAREAVSQPGTAPERLARLGPVSVEFYGENSLLNAVLRRDTEFIFAPVLEPMHARVLDETVAIMAELIRQGIREEALCDVDPERTAYILFIAGQTLYNESHYPYQETLPLYVQMVQLGLLRR